MDKLKLICPCLFGLESVLSGEVKRMGGENIEVTDGRVAFEGDYNMLARANLVLRTAERVLICLAQFKATTFEELFQGVKAIPLENFIGSEDEFPVKGWSLNSKLHSIPDCQKIIKKACVERLKAHYGIEWFSETGPLHQIQFSIRKDEVTIMLDTSGPGLHKRGYRQNSNAAPIKETLAAGIIDLARVKADTTVIDPFCGSGTFVIESALKATNIPSGINRRFASEKWSDEMAEIFRQERARALEFVRRDATFHGHGYDIDSACTELTRQNAKKAGISSRISVGCADIKDFVVPEGDAVVICNPPYGERLLEIQEAEKIYKTMGQVFVPKPGVRYFIISPHEDFETIFGRKADKRRKLYNGMIKCQLYMYF
ncbi:MAG: class I SAM-dependent RNA methyltransferase [Oscillospiraceae bacterium]|nr:class I SAM-dependent RNA methyltransferase [Oscillospiraceae bacterium]